MKSVLRAVVCSFAWAVALEVVTAGTNAQARHELSEQELNARIAQESNPTRKAKLEIQLGELKLGEATAAYDHDQFEEGPKLLQIFRGCMKQAWDLLEKSGRDAGHKPQGFKELDIALRESARRLNDLKQRTPLADRGGIETVSAQIDTLHSEVLAALFPGGKLNESPPAGENKPAPTPHSALRPGDPPS
jgi:hypothetical protein